MTCLPWIKASLIIKSCTAKANCSLPLEAKELSSMVQISLWLTRLIAFGDLSTFFFAHVDFPEAGNPIVK